MIIFSYFDKKIQKGGTNCDSDVTETIQGLFTCTHNFSELSDSRELFLFWSIINLIAPTFIWKVYWVLKLAGSVKYSMRSGTRVEMVVQRSFLATSICNIISKDKLSLAGSSSRTQFVLWYLMQQCLRQCHFRIFISNYWIRSRTVGRIIPFTKMTFPPPSIKHPRVHWGQWMPS